MDPLDDPHTIVLTTAVGSGTPTGLVACMVVWCLVGALVGYVFRWLEGSRIERVPVVVLRAAGDDDKVATADKQAPSNRKTRAKEMQADIDRKRTEPEPVEGEDEEDWTDNSSEDGSDASSSEDSEALEEKRMKMVLIVRKDDPVLTAQQLAVSAASAAINVLAATHRAYHATAPLTTEGAAVKQQDVEQWWQWYIWWNRIGVAKITLRCPDRSALLQLRDTAIQHGLPCYLENGSVLAVGPAPSDDLNVVSGSLKLLN